MVYWREKGWSEGFGKEREGIYSRRTLEEEGCPGCPPKVMRSLAVWVFSPYVIGLPGLPGGDVRCHTAGLRDVDPRIRLSILTA